MADGIHLPLVHAIDAGQACCGVVARPCRRGRPIRVAHRIARGEEELLRLLIHRLVGFRFLYRFVGARKRVEAAGAEYQQARPSRRRPKEGASENSRCGNRRTAFSRSQGRKRGQRLIEFAAGDCQRCVFLADWRQTRLQNLRVERGVIFQ